MKKYKLKESELRGIIREAVINEIGNTPKYNFALNAVRGRRAAKQYRTNMGTRERAENNRVMNMAGDIAYKNYKENPELGYDNPAGYFYGFQKGIDKYQNNESKLRGIIRETVKNVLNEGESGGWIVDSSEAEEAYNLAVKHMGKEMIDDAIIRSLGSEILANALSYIFRLYDFREWHSRFDE